jgi:hypothetical protein
MQRRVDPAIRTTHLGHSIVECVLLTLIRGGHYGQRSCVPRKQAEHMAAPTQCCNVKILLANPEPSTHGPTRTSGEVCYCAAISGTANLRRIVLFGALFVSTSEPDS